VSAVVLTKVQEVFKELFDVDLQSVSLDTKGFDIPAWDSVGHLSLCGALEEAFEVVFDSTELAEMNNVRAIVSIIYAKKGLAEREDDAATWSAREARS
jgi:acyl carrier protein